MATGSNITITLVLKDQATQGIKKVQAQVGAFRNEIKQFNRNLFTAAALLATFGVAFKKITDLAKSGASFEYIRKQFADVFKPEYLFRLQEFSKGTVDAMTTMQEALRMKRSGLGPGMIENVFKMVSFYSKRLGKDPGTVLRELGEALAKGDQKLAASYMVILRGNNQLQIQNKVIASVTKGYGSLGATLKNVQTIMMSKLMDGIVQTNKGAEDSVDIFLQYAASAKSLKDQLGELVARGVSPLVKSLSTVTTKSFEGLYTLMSDKSPEKKAMRNGIIDLTRHILLFSGAVIGMVAGFSAFSILLAPLGFTITGIAGVLTIAFGALKAFKNEGESWGRTFANMGTILQMFWEAFSSFDPKKGTAVFSGDVWERFKQFPKQTRDNIMSLIKALAILKSGLFGIRDGFKAVMDVASAAIDKIGKFLGVGGGKQTTSSWISGAHEVGKWIGGIGTIILMLKGLGTIGGVVRGAFGKLGTWTNPMIVTVTNMGGTAGGIGMLNTTMGRLVGALGAFTAGALYGQALNDDPGIQLANRVADAALWATNPNNPDASNFGSWAEDRKRKGWGQKGLVAHFRKYEAYHSGAKQSFMESMQSPSSSSASMSTELNNPQSPLWDDMARSLRSLDRKVTYGNEQSPKGLLVK